MALFGINQMSSTLIGQLEEKAKSWLSRFTRNTLTAILTGTLINIAMDSPSAVIVLAIVLGAELGTCGSTLLATIKGTRDALKTGLFHTLFIGLGLALYTPFVAFIAQIAGDESQAQQIAIAHIVFNCIAVVVMVPWLPLSEMLLNRLIPPKMTQCCRNFRGPWLACCFSPRRSPN